MNEDEELSVKNLGSSINSEADDFGLCLYDEYRGFFSSNRAGNDDLYLYINHDPKLKVIHLHLKVQLINSDTELPVPVGFGAAF